MGNSGLSECTVECFSRRSIAAVDDPRIITGCPNTFRPMISPATAFKHRLNQIYHWGPWGLPYFFARDAYPIHCGSLGTSNVFPITGSGLGPGGSLLLAGGSCAWTIRTMTSNSSAVMRRTPLSILKIWRQTDSSYPRI